jgi:N-acetylated-alpha-linked acidic dipeptidase
LARLWGVLTLRLANAELLPYHFGSYGAHLQAYLDTLSAHIDTSRLDLAPLRARIAAFEAAGQRLDSLAGRALAAGTLDPLLADQINRGMMDIERNFIHLTGIPGRPAYKHLVYACRPTYAHLELPGLTEAAERGDWALAAEQARVLEQAVGRNADLLGSLVAQLGGATGMET